MREYEEIREANRRIPLFSSGMGRNKKVDGVIAGAVKIPLIYQYRTFESFWEILKSDSFWATNARFCNDEEEQKFGERVVEILYETSKNKNEKRKNGLDENYIVCFCKEDDKLSQWRGYASDGGVALGFDFGSPRAFSILQNEQKDTQTMQKCKIQYVALGAVCYMEPQEENESEKAYRDKCRSKIGIISSFSGKGSGSISTAEVELKAPFIKHRGFEEEDEYRLVFQNRNRTLDDCVRYREDKQAMLKYPYIVVKAGFLDRTLSKCVVRVCLQSDEEETALVKELKVAFAKQSDKILVRGCHLIRGEKPNAEKETCVGCTLRWMESVSAVRKCQYQYEENDGVSEYCLHEKESCVIISQWTEQKEVFEKVYKCVQQFKRKKRLYIDVWCEGHLPLRKITVGPCNNQNNMVEAIRHYCKHTYWLRDVEIAVSKIPFRKSL